jgi:flagellar hook assembly protein FlgD
MVFALHQNYPNPFNPTTTIQYDLPEDSRVRLTVYDIQGRVVAVISDGVQPAGFRFVIWNGRDVRGLPAAAGIYFLRLDTPSFHDTRKMILLK